jgi:hypothetical protein
MLRNSGTVLFDIDPKEYGIIAFANLGKDGHEGFYVDNIRIGGGGLTACEVHSVFNWP